ncbi:MAG: type II toxin-antitoxin system VapC family toxin [archaeon]
MSVLVDSYGWIEYFTNGPLADKYAKYIEKANKKEYLVSSVILYEVYKKIRATKNEQIALEAVAQIMQYNTVIDLNGSIALEAADLTVKYGLGFIDATIKATAESNDAVLVTSDKHFKGLNNVILLG